MKIGILGRGLMGGSLYKGLPGALIFEKDWMDRIEEIDLLILAVPISAILEISEQIARLPLRKKLLVMDIGSVKAPIAQKFEEWTEERVEFLPTHPMAGKEKSGYEHSDSAIFHGAAWVITPHRKTSQSALERVKTLISLLGSHPIEMDAKEHDQRAALISHLPYLIAKTLLDFVDPQSRSMAGPGFKSIARLAMDNPEMRREIYRYNQKNIDESLHGYIDALKNLLYGI